MGEVLAVAVIFGLHWLLVPIVAALILFVAIYLTRNGSIRTRILVPIFALLAFHLVLTWDVYVGKWYTKHLCNSTELFVVNEVVKLPNSYWDKYGWPKFHARTGVYKKFLPQVLNNEYVTGGSTEHLDSFFEVRKHTSTIERVKTREIMMVYTQFNLGSGWFSRFMAPQGNRDSYACGREARLSNSIPGAAHNDIYTSWVFIPEEPLEIK